MIDREALAQIVRDFVEHFGTNSPSMRWEKIVTDDGARLVAHKGDIIFWDDPNHNLTDDPDDTDNVRFDKIVALANAAPAILEALTHAGEGAVPAWCNPNAIARIRSIADTLDRARAIQDADWAFLHGVADAIAKIAAPHPPRQDGAMCQTCQGNGEIVTDWDRYMKGNTDANGDEAVAECPDCNGSGKVSQDGAREAVAWVYEWKPAEGSAAASNPWETGVSLEDPRTWERLRDLRNVRPLAYADTTPPAPDEAVEAPSIPTQKQMNEAFYIDVCNAEDKLKAFAAAARELLDSLPAHWHGEAEINLADMCEEIDQRETIKGRMARSRRDGGGGV